MTSPKWVIDTPSTSTANQDPSEQKFSTIPLNDNGLEMVPIEMATIANETFSSAENVPPAPFLRGFSRQQNEDSIRFPHLPAVPRNVHKILNWFNRKPWIFPLSYCIVFCLILLLAIVLAWMNVKFWFFFPTIDNPKLEGLSHAFLPYFYVLVTIYAFLMALTGYARYCQLDYFLQCAAQKIEDQANSLTFPGRFPNIAYSTLLREKVVKYKKHNKETFSFLLVASLCQLILGNFSFGPFSIVYWMSFFVYYVLIWTYCICMTIIMHFISQKFNYESFSLEMVAISIIGSVFGIVYVVILGAEIFFNPHFPSTLFAMLELISNFFFPAFSFITFLKMYKFPNWKNVRTF